MLSVVKIEMWTHRPPSLPSWKVTYKRDATKDIYVRYPFAEDEMAAWADTLRWWQWRATNFENSDSQNP